MSGSQQWRIPRFNQDVSSRWDLKTAFQVTSTRPKEAKFGSNWGSSSGLSKHEGKDGQFKAKWCISSLAHWQNLQSELTAAPAIRGARQRLLENKGGFRSDWWVGACGYFRESVPLVSLFVHGRALCHYCSLCCCWRAMRHSHWLLGGCPAISKVFTGWWLAFYFAASCLVGLPLWPYRQQTAQWWASPTVSLVPST